MAVADGSPGFSARHHGDLELWRARHTHELAPLGSARSTYLSIDVAQRGPRPVVARCRGGRALPDRTGLAPPGAAGAGARASGGSGRPLRPPAPLTPDPGDGERVARQPTRAAASASSSRKSGWAMLSQRGGALAHGEALELDGAVLGDDHVHLVARGGDEHLRTEVRHDPAHPTRRPAPSPSGGRAGSGPRARRPDPARKSSWPPMPECWRAVDGVGRHLTVEVDRHRAVDRHEVPVAGDELGRVDDVDRQEPRPRWFSSQPLVELRACRRRRSSTEYPSNSPLSALVTLPALCSCMRPLVNISECTP